MKKTSKKLKRRVPINMEKELANRAKPCRWYWCNVCEPLWYATAGYTKTMKFIFQPCQPSLILKKYTILNCNHSRNKHILAWQMF
jgi:hypothetical protein